MLELNSTGEKVIKVKDLTLTLKKGEIGRGAFCKVLKCDGVYEELGEEVPYALKVYVKSQLQHEVATADVHSLKIMKEIDRLQDIELPLWGKIRHPNIVTAFTLFENEGNTMYLMM